jgi:Asp/Glu/hydantoin racemase
VRTQSINAIPVPVEPVFPSVERGSEGPSHSPVGGRFLGILMLETQFPRPLGDIGHPESFPVPTRRLVVGGATAPRVVQDAAGLAASGLLAAFTSAARQLEREGAAAITTSCGFLVLFQRELREAVRVPLVTSSLLMLPGLLRMRPRVGVLTISSERLGPPFLEASGVPAERLRDVLVEGVDPRGQFAGAVLGNRATMDFERASAEVVSAAVSLKSRAPDIADLVLECTNMPPYAKAVEAATGLKTWSLLQCHELLRPFEAGSGGAAP